LSKEYSLMGLTRSGCDLKNTRLAKSG